MKNHTKIFIKYFNIGQDEMILCEYCKTNYTNQVHHIDRRGMGGSKKKDVIQNLMGLCLDPCHELAEAEKLDEEMLWEIHKQNLKPEDRIDYKNREKLFK